VKQTRAICGGSTDHIGLGRPDVKFDPSLLRGLRLAINHFHLSQDLSYPMDQRTLATLELPRLIELLAGRVSSALGRKRALSIKPLTDLADINLELDRTSECTNYLSTGGGFGLAEVEDPTAAVEELGVEGTSLDAKQLIELQTLISVGVSLKEQFADSETRERYPQLAAIASRITDLRKVLASMRGKILPNGEIDDSASPELRRIRREINDRRTRIYRNLESLMRERVQSAIQEDVVTVRNGRFVIPVRTDSRGQVPGVNHGLSSSGQTTYVEPMTIIDQNNELVRLREQEEIEIAQILFAMTESLRANLDGIKATIEAITEIDFAQAKGRLSIEFNCVRPDMIDERRLILNDARHLLLEYSLRSSGAKVVPISLEMDEQHQTLVVSGPNAGGKTVVTKTVGLLAFMAQMGMHVPSGKATLPVFKQILADIGDQQSIAANLSTFTAHIKNLAEMMRLVSSDSPISSTATAADVSGGIRSHSHLPALILIDEVGTGTDPDEGAALAIAIVNYFQRAGATTVATTHYNPLKVWASQTDGVLNASVEFDEKTLRPTYRLIVGIAGASSGLEIARRMELPAEVIGHAADNLSPLHSQATEYLKKLKSLVDEQSALRDALEDERSATAEKYSKLDLEFAQREASRRAQFEDSLAEVIRDFADESARTIAAIKDRVAAARLKRDAEARAADLKRSAGVRLKKYAATAPVTSSQVPPGGSPSPGSKSIDAGTIEEGQFAEAAAEIGERDQVRITSLGQVGIVESISGEEYTVLVGSLRFRARRGELQLVKAAGAPTSRLVASLPRGVTADIDSRDGFITEINVIGTTVDEARDLIDKFLDEAFLAGAERVRIVHGHGKGALRKGTAELLSGHPHVESFSQAPQNEGGSGATVVLLRK
jgi:DNA mismatch repair protein MutS2